MQQLLKYFLHTNRHDEPILFVADILKKAGWVGFVSIGLPMPGGSLVRTSFLGSVSGSGSLWRCVRIKRFRFPQGAQSFGILHCGGYIITFRFDTNPVSNVWPEKIQGSKFGMVRKQVYLNFNRHLRYAFFAGTHLTLNRIKY